MFANHTSTSVPAAAERPIAVITGASSGIGAATARLLAANGYRVYLGARRVERCQALAAELDGVGVELDVTAPDSVAAFCAAIPEPAISVLVNNAGGALGLDPVVTGDDARFEQQWLEMWQSNVMGLARMTRALYPRLRAARPVGHVVNIGSIAGVETYRGGAGYVAAKHAVRAITETLRLEWLGQPIRLTEIAPGLVQTEFSQVRFDGDLDRAAAVYRDMTPLTAEDVARAVGWVVAQPPHVNVDYLLLRPLDQARAHEVFRHPSG